MASRKWFEGRSRSRPLVGRQLHGNRIDRIEPTRYWNSPPGISPGIGSGIALGPFYFTIWREFGNRMRAGR